MELQADSALTKRENQIAGLAACGLAKKEIADRLGTAYGTVNVLLDKAYKKTGTSKLNELGAWWINLTATTTLTGVGGQEYEEIGLKKYMNSNQY